MKKEQRAETQLMEFLSTSEAARILRVHPVAIRQMLRGGRLPGVRVGRNWIIPRHSLLEFARDYVKGPGPRWKTARKDRRQT
jgi:excisionase family DNA binding protein